VILEAMFSLYAFYVGSVIREAISCPLYAFCHINITLEAILWPLCELYEVMLIDVVV
jgi:hypothetical protein